MRSLFLLCLLFGICASNIIVSEIMYNPRQGNDYQFIEFYNTGESSVDMSGWIVTTSGITFTFPSASIEAKSFLILANKKENFLFAYPSVPSSLVFGDLTGGSLDTGSAEIQVKDAGGQIVLDIEYKDSWRPLSDGFGPSLELVCFDVSNFTDKNVWVASSVYTITDPLLEYSGSPNSAGSWYSCPPPKGDGAQQELLISEIMYHPQKEKSREDQHEWLEIYNPNAFTVSLDGYRIIGKKGIRFAFPKGSVIAANAYTVVAKNSDAFSSIYGTNVNVFGGYTNELANGDEIALINSNGQIDDRISYDNKWPWPIAADAQYDGTQYKGLSIERVSFAIGDKSYNWVASTPTPGAANTAARTTPLPIVTDKTIFQNGVEAKSKLAPSVSTTITVKVSPKGTASNVVLEYFVDDLTIGSETITSVSMTANEDETYSYNFANGFAAQTILRFRVKADFNSQTGQVISHRSNDPVQWHGIYFSVAGALSTSSDVYEIMITQSNWTEMWTNMKTETRYRLYLDDPSSSQCCIPNPTWNKLNSAVLAYKGQVYDVQVKYQGSNYNRMNGNLITRFDGSPIPEQPEPLRQLSWSIRLSDYDSKIDGRSEILIQKSKDEGCSFLTGKGLYDMARQLGIPAPYVKFSQLYVNGGYYLYGMDIDYYSNNMMEKFIKQHNAKNCKDQATPAVGLMFKAGGFGCNDGYNALADFQYVTPSSGCGFDVSTNERLSNAYNLETQNSWGTVDTIANLTSKMGQYSPNKIVFSDPPSQEAKDFLEANFDVNMVLNYLVLMNFAGAYDDLTLNYMVYVRDDGKTQMAVWDMDELLGGNALPCGSPQCTLFLGEEGAPVSQWQVAGAFNNLKNAFIKTYRAELVERFRVLSKTVLSAENFSATLQNAQDAINVDEYDNDPAWIESENIRGGCLASFKSWTSQRSAYILSSQGDPQSLDYDICPDTPTSTRYVNTYQAVPGTPKAPNVALSSTAASISWYAPNSNGLAITSYNLQRSSNGGEFSTIFSGSGLSYTDNDISSGALFRYRLSAVNSMGESQYSATRSSTGEVGATTPVTGSASSSAVPTGTTQASNDNSAASSILMSIYTIAAMVAFSLI